MTQTIGGEIELSRLNALIVHAACDCILAQRRETAPGTVVEIAQCKL